MELNFTGIDFGFVQCFVPLFLDQPVKAREPTHVSCEKGPCAMLYQRGASTLTVAQHCTGVGAGAWHSQV